MMSDLENALSRFGRDANVSRGENDALIVAPDSEELAREIVAWCGRDGVPFVPCGSPIPSFRVQDGTLLISTQNLTRVLDWDEGNATVEAQAGLTLRDLNAIVSTRNQFVPLDDARLDTDSRSTLGGALAQNASGPSRLKWGAPRDLTVGLRAMLSDNREVRAGAKVVKNVAGYDLTKLFVGSHGTLGLITRAITRLRPRDAAYFQWQSEPLTFQDARLRCEQLLGSSFEPTWVVATRDENRWRVGTCLEGGEASVAAQRARLPDSTCDFASATPPELPELPELPDDVWRIRAQMPLASAHELVAQLEERIEHSDAMLSWDAGNGVIRAAWPTCAPETLRALRREIESFGGAMKIEAAPQELGSSDVWGQAPQSLPLMRALKQKFDAANVCAPGRFVGGL